LPADDRQSADHSDSVSVIKCLRESV